ncbi:MobV family relaxase [Vibrio splendidus]
MGTTILRFEKIKNMANVRGAGAHQYRHHADTPNADPEKKSRNRGFAGTNNLGADVQAKLNELDKQPRKNAVIAMDGLLTLSPEMLETSENLNAWGLGVQDWLKDTFGDNLVNAVVHLDESSPHVHFTVVPMSKNDKGENRLNARDMFNKFNLSDYQKSYFAKMKTIFPDLEPPSHGSKRKHTDLKEFYSQLDEIKSELKTMGVEMLEEIKGECKETLMSKYLPRVDSVIKNLAEELEGRLTDDMKAKVKNEMTEAIEEGVNKAFDNTPTVNNAVAKIEDKIENAKVEISAGKPRRMRMGK